MLVPAPVKRGDFVRVIAPSGPFEVPLLWRGLGFLRQHFRVRFSRGIFERHGYLAGDDTRRAEELAHALGEADTSAIFAARGGYGATRFAHQMPWETLRENPKWIVGFSDITALHLEAMRVDVASLHASNVTGLGRSDARCRDGMLSVLANPTEPRTFEGLTTVRAGTATGPVLGGNLALIEAVAASGRLTLPPGAILLIEDVGERPYRIDRMLTSLLVGGHLGGLSGVIVGEFLACNPGVDGTTVVDVIADRLAPLGVPIVRGAPVGHGRANEPVGLGLPASLDAGEAGKATVTVGGVSS